MTSPVPPVGPPRPMRLPAVAERVLPSGLKVLAARRPGIPRFEVRLRIPTVRRGAASDAARAMVLAETLLSGTPERTSVEIAERLQHLGATLGAVSDTESVALVGSALSTNLRPFLAVLAEVVTGASFPSDEVALERERLASDLTVAHSQPDTIARDALLRRLWPDHPYGRGLPEVAAVAKVSAAALRKEHAARLLPAGSVLVVVGDASPARVLDAAEAALGSWAAGAAAGRDRLATPPDPPAGPVLIVDRPRSVQTNIRLAGPAVGRRDPRFPSLVLANAVFGGYFTSRLVDNIRERRGYTYSPGSGLEHRQAATAFTVSADVGTDVTAAALLEIRYELGRMVTAPVAQDELDAARRYLLGTLSMSLQTQAGLTSYLAMLAAYDLDIDYLRGYPKVMQKVGVDDVLAVAVEYLAPRRLVTVLVGEADAIAGPVSGLDAVETVAAGSA